MDNVRGIRVAGGTFPAEIWGDYMKVAKRKFCKDWPEVDGSGGGGPVGGGGGQNGAGGNGVDNPGGTNYGNEPLDGSPSQDEPGQ